MHSIFHARSQWFFCKFTPIEPDPKDFQKDGQTDFKEFDIAMRNYREEVLAAKRHAVRIHNAWLLEQMFVGVQDGELIPVEIECNLMVMKICRLEPKQSEQKSLTKRGGNMNRR